MKADAIRSGRLRSLLALALNGATIEQLSQKCQMWGVTKATEKSYIDAVVTRIQIMRKQK
mgnify:FL=1|jgi:hypothetical protein